MSGAGHSRFVETAWCSWASWYVCRRQGRNPKWCSQWKQGQLGYENSVPDQLPRVSLHDSSLRRGTESEFLRQHKFFVFLEQLPLLPFKGNTGWIQAGLSSTRLPKNLGVEKVCSAWFRGKSFPGKGGTKALLSEPLGLETGIHASRKWPCHHRNSGVGSVKFCRQIGDSSTCRKQAGSLGDRWAWALSYLNCAAWRIPRPSKLHVWIGFSLGVQQAYGNGPCRSSHTIHNLARAEDANVQNMHSACRSKAPQAAWTYDFHRWDSVIARLWRRQSHFLVMHSAMKRIRTAGAGACGVDNKRCSWYSRTSFVIHMYVCMYACMRACVYVCMLVCMYVCMRLCICVYVYVPKIAIIDRHVFTEILLYVCMCMYDYVCRYVCMYMYVCTYVLQRRSPKSNYSTWVFRRAQQSTHCGCLYVKRLQWTSCDHNFEKESQLLRSEFRTPREEYVCMYMCVCMCVRAKNHTGQDHKCLSPSLPPSFSPSLPPCFSPSLYLSISLCMCGWVGTWVCVCADLCMMMQGIGQDHRYPPWVFAGMYVCIFCVCVCVYVFVCTVLLCLCVYLFVCVSVHGYSQVYACVYYLFTWAYFLCLLF